MKEMSKAFVRLCDLLKDYHASSQERYRPMIAAELQAIQWQAQKSKPTGHDPSIQGLTQNAKLVLQRQARIEEYFCSAKLALKHLNLSELEYAEQVRFLDELRQDAFKKIPCLPLLAFQDQENLLHELIHDASEHYLLQANQAVQKMLEDSSAG